MDQTFEDTDTTEDGESSILLTNRVSLLKKPIGKLCPFFRAVFQESKKSSIYDYLQSIPKSLIRQRGIGNTNPVKFGRCIKELERIYGIKNGGDRGNQYKEAEPQIAELPTQSDLASQFGMSVDTLKRYKDLAFIENLQVIK